MCFWQKMGNIPFLIHSFTCYEMTLHIHDVEKGKKNCCEEK